MVNVNKKSEVYFVANIQKTYKRNFYVTLKTLKNDNRKYNLDGNSTVTLEAYERRVNFDF